MNTISTHSEAALIRNCIDGDRKYQKALYDLYAKKVFAICLRYTRNQMDAEDVLQEGFVKVFNNLHKFKSEGSFEGWIRRIFVNTSIEYLRNKKIISVECELVENCLSDRQPSALQNLFNMDILKSTDKLSSGYRTVFNLYAVEGYSHQEIATTLGITESTSKSQYSRAKAALRTIVQRNGAGRSLLKAV